MTSLSRREEQVLLAIWNLKESAYLLGIKEFLSGITNSDWSVGIIHKPLLQLERKGCITSFMGQATPKRGGRRKKMYRITRHGIEALKALKEEHKLLWQNFLRTQIL
ncbi:PadR family transcriptional regulator [candidate division KSB1 bacterium]